MYRLIEEIGRSGFVTAWRFANCPTSRSPVFVKATTDGVVRDPSELAMTVGLCPSITATTELVVPRSMPTTLHMCCVSRFPSSVDQPSRMSSVRALPLTVAQGVGNRRHSGGATAYHTPPGYACSSLCAVTIFLAQWLQALRVRLWEHAGRRR